MTDIVIKRGTGKPDSLLEGELAIDTSTGRLYSLVGGVVTELNEPPEDIDLSDYVDKTAKNYVNEGDFQLVWDDSSDPSYPFNGRIGYNSQSTDPNSLDGSFLYINGTRGTFSIGRDGDVELHGSSEILGVEDRLTGERPWITGFSYVQAADFLDADGNSIIGAGGDPAWADVSADEPVQSMALGYNAVAGDMASIAIGWGATTDFNENVLIGAGTYSKGIGTVTIGTGASSDHNDTVALGQGASPTKIGEFAISPYVRSVNFSGARLISASSYTVEQTVLGGINITGVEADRPDELPFSADEKSVQYALSVTHETLGRTVEIDKEGIIRARSFTDMDGNPIGGGDGGNIADGEAEGAIAKWDSAANQWVSEPNITVTSSPDALQFGRYWWLRFTTGNGDKGITIRDDRIFVNRPGGAGLAFWSKAKTGEADPYDSAIVPCSYRGAEIDTGSQTVDLGVPKDTRDEDGNVAAHPFQNGYFSGTVQASEFLDADGNPIGGAAAVDSVNGKTGAVTLTHTDVGALPSSYVPPPPDLSAYSTTSQADAKYQAKGSYAATSHSHSEFVPKSGNSTISGTLTATDFVASSDERAKDNISTAPVGLIDSLKGREWEWKESGEKGSGVVAQELEEVLPHLVHTDDEGMKSVAYNGLLAYLIEELKDCRQRLSVLEGKE